MAAEVSGSAVLLPINALRGVAVGISVSESADLNRLGLEEAHLRLLLGEVTRTVLLSGGTIVYGGRLDPDGYTAFLRHEVEKYARPNEPLVSCLPWSVHRALTVGELRAAKEELALNGRLVCLDREGKPVDPEAGRSGEASKPMGSDEIADGLSAMRRYLTEITGARLFLGGKREGFQGLMPGVLEEALSALAAKQPVYLAGGFGGVVGDMVRALGVPGTDWLAPPSLGPASPQAGEWLDKLSGIDATAAFAGNGLTADESQRLATAYRPSEIASLVATGLGRLSGQHQLEEDH